VPTVTVIESLPDPPVPVHVSVNVDVAVRGPTDAVPLTALVPLQDPLAVQLVALVVLQVSVEEPPLATLVGLAVSVTVGAALVTVTVALLVAVPPTPVQVRL
jgi:hypothetical protein